MQFGVFSVSDITRDPVAGYTPSEAERIDAVTQIARKTEEVGMDVFAIGEHHNPPFFSSSPTTLLAAIAATTQRLIVTTATTLITTNDPALFERRDLTEVAASTNSWAKPPAISKFLILWVASHSSKSWKMVIRRLTSCRSAQKPPDKRTAVQGTGFMG